MAQNSSRPQSREPADGRRHQRAKANLTRTTILEAAAEVVRTDGVAALTLNRVAEVAGVSKGGLLYHFASKQELVVAMLTTTLATADDHLEQLAAENDRDTGAFAQAYLDYVRSDEHSETDSASGIFAAAALGEGDLALAQQQFAEWQRRLIDDDGLDPAAALLARVVGDGLWLIDLFGLAPPSVEQRNALCALVEEMIDR